MWDWVEMVGYLPEPILRAPDGVNIDDDEIVELSGQEQ